MKFALTLALAIFSLKSFAITGVEETVQPQLRPAKPKIFVGDLNIHLNRQETILSLTYSPSEEYQVDQTSQRLLDEKIAELTSANPAVAVARTHYVQSYGFEKQGVRSVEVHASGEIRGQLLSTVQSELTPLEVTSWAVAIYRGNNHLRGIETLEPEYIKIEMEDGRAVLRMNESFAANLVNDVKAYVRQRDWKFQPEKLRAVLTPKKWQAVEGRRYPMEVDLHGSMRGQFTYTHERVNAAEAIVLSFEQTMELLHITRPTLLSRCLAALSSK